MYVHHHLLLRIERYLEETGMPATAFGRLIARDPRLVLDMRRGRTAGAALQARAEHFMNFNQESCQ